MDDDVRRSDESGVFVPRNAEVKVPIECWRVERPVEGDLRPNLDLRREPVLPADTSFDVVGLCAGALALDIIEPLETPGDVVQRVGLVIGRP